MYLINPGEDGASAIVSATAHLGQTILAGTALIGGASGIAQSTANGDPLGIAAGALEVAAAVAGGLVSTNELSTPLTKAINLAAGVASTATSVADAFKNGDLAGGLAGSLNALLPLIAQRVMELAGSSGAQTAQANGASATKDLPPPIPTGGDGSNEVFPISSGSNPYGFAFGEHGALDTGQGIPAQSGGGALSSAAVNGVSPNDPARGGTLTYTLPDGSGPQTAVVAGSNRYDGYILAKGYEVASAYVNSFVPAGFSATTSELVVTATRMAAASPAFEEWLIASAAAAAEALAAGATWVVRLAGTLIALPEVALAGALNLLFTSRVGGPAQILETGVAGVGAVY